MRCIRKSGLIALGIAICIATSLAQASQPDWTPRQVVEAPGGYQVFYLMQSGHGDDATTEITEGEGNRVMRVLVSPRPSPNPDQNLTGFSAITLSPDARTLYFDTAAYATSAAVHALDLRSGGISLVTSGELSCVVMGGEYEGDLVVQKHRYFVEGGSYDPLVLITPSGKDLGLVALEPMNRRDCQAIGE